MEEDLHTQEYHTSTVYETPLSMEEKEAADEFLKGDREYDLDGVVFDSKMLTETYDDTSIAPDEPIQEDSTYGFSIRSGPE